MQEGFALYRTGCVGFGDATKVQIAWVVKSLDLVKSRYCEQLIGAIVACFLLKAVTGGLIIPIHSVGAGVGAIEGVVMEIIMTFALVYTVYATAADPKKGSLGTIAPIAIGFTDGANILAAGPFSGGSMNPARSFGPAVTSGDYHDIWIYWVGPLIGGGLTGLIYDNVFMVHSHVPLSNDF